MATRPSAACLTLVLSACLGGCGASATRSASAPRPVVASTTITPTATTVSVVHRRRVHRHRPAPDPGRLPQTEQLPSSHTRAFHDEMRALWAGVRSASLRPAAHAFFPEAAYVQVKSIGDPEGDYEGRLLEDFQLDLEAAHALLGTNPRLLEVVVPGAYAHWVSPGACYNRVGYYEVPNSRLVYRDDSGVRSFGIASMISWRGVWYVVHLGAVVRASAAGLVDDPSPGVGTPVPSSTC